MKDYQYYGLFLTEESKNRLKSLLRDCVKNPSRVTRVYLDHCTLLHKSQEKYQQSLKCTLDSILESLEDYYYITIDGIGVSKETMAFRVTGVEALCANKIPHITICTFEGGKPVDSNKIVEWMNITPIVISTKFKRI